MSQSQKKRRQRGAALLLAMLVVTLVATLASAALWQQWRSTEVETAERQRVQAGWLLTGAVDWARLILREDARSNRNTGSADHLGEPWATPLEEAQLSSFLAADPNNNTEDLLPAFLSGEIVDAQAKLNAFNLVRTKGVAAKRDAEVSAVDVAAFKKLYELLNLPEAELTAAVDNLLRSTEQALNNPEPSATPLLPTRFSQLGWLGISEASLEALSPHVTWLPTLTPLNLNTASAQALCASVPVLDLATAERLVVERGTTPFRDLPAAAARIPGATAETLKPNEHDVRSRYFEVTVRLRLDNRTTQERSLVVRTGLKTGVVWRERTAVS
ncbi:general secretion pathway protein GspK [Hydrogenophaga crassostreae]|uniref:Type II secretion system protein K n=1 Tax=Hydrogenophaga crassostreae TaxID=1763535 RepID=A0A163CE44_9BURK|nr:type II secretion system minor pseudopilin GspK [Hydrogenophaga crassostreae]AOW11983.1 general secretion pathway protein GspK [Hydrogenophaga crassostreae]OAD41546.1 general secretion pathway protein GspK [Hydrogenophaga crassostreae]